MRRNNDYSYILTSIEFKTPGLLRITPLDAERISPLISESVLVNSEKRGRKRGGGSRFLETVD